MINWDFLFISDLRGPWGAPQGPAGTRGLLWAIVHRLRGEEEEETEKRNNTLSGCSNTFINTPAAPTSVAHVSVILSSYNSHSPLQKKWPLKTQCFKSIAEKNNLTLWVIYVHRAGVTGWKQIWVNGRYDAPGRNDHDSGWAFKQMNWRIWWHDFISTRTSNLSAQVSCI